MAQRVLGPALPEEERRERNRRDGDRHVDEEDPGPAEVRGEHTAEQHAHGGATACGGAVDAERDVALTALGEGGDQQREGGGSKHCAAEPLQGSERDQRCLGPREAAQQRARPEDREPGDEEPPSSEQVAETPTEQERPAEEDRVGRDDPLQALL